MILLNYWRHWGVAAHRRLRTIWRWRKRHPVLAVATAVLMVYVAGLCWGNAYVAHAASSGNPLLSGLDITDTQGVPFEHYGNLPIDRGDLATPLKMAYSVYTDFIWTGHVGMLATFLRILMWLLNFEWVDWILAPFAIYGDLLQGWFTQVQWAPFALLIAGAVGGVAMFFLGRVASGGMDLLFSAICAVLALTVLANPVGDLQGEDGSFTQARTWGVEFAKEAASDTEMGQVSGLSVDVPRDEVVGTVFGQQLVDMFIRLPAQEIAFGHTLEGDCDAAFTTAMTDKPPLDRSNDARNDVGACDEAAKEYSDNPSMWQPVSTAFVLLGSTGLNSVIGALVVLLALTILSGAWNAIAAMFWVHVGILPAVGRRQLAQTSVNILISVFCFGFFIVALVFALDLMLQVLQQLSDAGMPITLVMQAVTLVAFVIVIWLFWLFWKFKKGGAAFGRFMQRITLGGNGAPKSGPSVAEAVRTAAAIKDLVPSGGGQRPIKAPRSKSEAIKAAPEGAAPKALEGGRSGGAPQALTGGPLGPEDLGHVNSTPTGSRKDGPFAGPAGRSGRAQQLAANAGRLAIGAARGGWGGAALEAGRMAAGAVGKRLPLGGGSSGSGAGAGVGALPGAGSAGTGGGPVSKPAGFSMINSATGDPMTILMPGEGGPMGNVITVDATTGAGTIHAGRSRDSDSLYDISSMDLPTPKRSERTERMRGELLELTTARS